MIASQYLIVVLYSTVQVVALASEIAARYYVHSKMLNILRVFHLVGAAKLARLTYCTVLVACFLSHFDLQY